MNSNATVLTILTAAIILFSATVVKVYLSANSELKSAEDLVSRKELSGAAVHFERSIHWYLPGLGLHEKGAKGLWEIGLGYESKNDIENALSTYRLLRGALYSTRSFYTPGQEWISQCDEKIAFLMAAKPASNLSDVSKTLEQRKQEMMTLLTADKSPRSPWAFLAVTGFFGWVTCCLLFIARGLTKSGTLHARPALFWGAGFILSYGLWVLGLLNT